MNFGMNQIMKQAQKMQEKMKEAQQELSNVNIIGESGAGMVKIEMNGHREVIKVTLDPSIVNANEIEILEDLVAAATNDAVQKVEKLSQNKLTDLTGGFNLADLGLDLSKKS